MKRHSKHMSKYNFKKIFEYRNRCVAFGMGRRSCMGVVSVLVDYRIEQIYI